MPRHFLIIPLPDEVKDRLVALQPRDLTGIRLAGRQEMHLTLYSLGEIALHDDEAVRKALASVKANAFTITISGVGRFQLEGEPQVLWAGIESSPSLLALHKSIGNALAAATGFQPEELPYAPHITLARLNSPASPDAIERYLDDNKDFLISPVLLDRFALYSSVVVDGVPQYREEVMFQLTAPTTPAGQGGNDNEGTERPITAESSETDRPLPEPTWRPQFSLRSILVLTFAVAAWLSLCRMVPHIAVFVLGIILAAGSTYLLVRLKKKVRGCRLRRLDRRAFAFLRACAVLSWAFFYVVSIGPVILVVERTGLPRFPFQLFYFPVLSLLDSIPFSTPLEAYANAWGWH